MTVTAELRLPQASILVDRDAVPEVPPVTVQANTGAPNALLLGAPAEVWQARTLLDAGDKAARFMQPIDQDPFVIGLAAFDFQSQFSAKLHQTLFDVVKRLVTVDFRFTGTEQVEVRAVENKDFAQLRNLPG